MSGKKKLVAFGEQAFFDYYPTDAPRPYIGALFTPAGRRLTRDIATAPSGSDDHHHHKGIWWGHRNVSGSDIWTEFDGYGSNSFRLRSDPDSDTGTGRDPPSHDVALRRRVPAGERHSDDTGLPG